MIPLKNAENKGKNENLEPSAAVGAAVNPPNVAFDADLKIIIEHWASLPKAVKIGISAMVKASATKR